MEVSRQAVTKWEANASKPNSDNLIKLAQLFEVDVDTLLGNESGEEPSTQGEVSIGKMSWIFIGISVLGILAYILHSALTGIFSVGAFICMFILCIPIQLFLHIYFSKAIKNNSFNGIAGFDDKIEYNIYEGGNCLHRLICILESCLLYIFFCFV